jgi:outer membrane receptor protein involved in Fe transport
MVNRPLISATVIHALLVCLAANSQQPAVLENVTVWAQKREADLQNVPMSVSTLSDDELQIAGLNDIADVATRVPTVALQNSVSATTTSLRIRRVGSLGNIPTFEPAVGVFVDGVFRARSLSAAGDFVDVERIEVLRGPKSTLYGKNTSAGVVALYTKWPGAQFGGIAEVTNGWFDSADSPSMTRLKLRLGGPVTPTLGASIAAAHSSHGYTMSNALAAAPDSNDQDRLALRGQLAWSPSEAFDARLLVGYASERDHQGESDVFLAPGAPSTTVAGVLRDAGLGQECSDNQPHNRRSCALRVNTFDYEALDVTLLGRYRLSNGWTLTSVTGWDRYDALRTDGDVGQLSAPILFFNDAELGRSFQEELRLTSTEGGWLSWLIGAFYYQHDYRRGGRGETPMFGPNGAAAFHPIWSTLLRGTPLALPGQLGLHQSHIDTRYVSVFGDLGWQFTDRLSLTTGVRWQREEKKAGIHNSLTLPGASLISTTLTPSVSPSGEPVNGSIGRRSEHITWSITPQYRINAALMTYLEVARAAKSGGFSTGFGNAPLTAREFDDEHIRHHEIGARGTFSDARVRWSLATFYTEYRDYQDAAFVSAQFSVGNAHRVVLKGAEFEGVVLLATGLAADISVSAADLTYATNTTGACFPGRVPDGTAPRSCNLAGEHPINAPVWSAHLGLEQQRSMSWGEAYARIDWSWTDEYNTSFSADPRLKQDDYSDVALRVGARWGDSFEAALWGDNLLDEDVTYIDSVLNLFNDASYQSFMDDQRSYGITIRLHF